MRALAALDAPVIGRSTLAALVGALFPGLVSAADLERVTAVFELDPLSCAYRAEATLHVRFAPGDEALALVPPAGLTGEWKAGDTRFTIPAGEGLVRHDLSWTGGPSGEGFSARAGLCVTGFATHAWLPLPLSPKGADLIADAFALDLSLELPLGMHAAGPGLAAPVQTHGVREMHRFVLESPTPAYLLGFAAGPFVERWGLVTRADGSAVTLRTLLAPGTNVSFEDRFASTGPALEWLEEWTGVRYPDPVYTQVVVPGPAAQEKASFAVLGGRTVAIADGAPSEAWFVIHELAHQWFGRQVGPSDWSENWLNEGFAVLATQLFSGHTWGVERGEAELARARARLGRVLESGGDRPLRVPAWTDPADAGGAVAYTKSLLVLDRLRRMIGAAAFDDGVRRWFAAAPRPSAASSESLIDALRGAAPDAPLDAFVGEWVDAVGDTPALLVPR